jgi:hypothetical protein
MFKKLEDATFCKLVQDIDNKWRHTYETVKEEDSTLDTNLDNLLTKDKTKEK